MKMKITLFSAALVVACMPGFASGQTTLYSNDMSSSAGWTINAFSADDTATFGYDYLAGAGIPAPPGGPDTIGLRLDANTVSGAEGGVTVTPTGQSFSGNYTLSYDVWIQWDSTTGGSTEYAGGGVGYDGTTNNGDLGSGSGGYLQLVGDGSSSRDYRMYKNASEQFMGSFQYNPALGSNNGIDPLFAPVSPVVDMAGFDPPQTGATGLTDLGDPGFNWTHVEIIVVEAAGTARIEVDGLWLGTLDASAGAVPLSGAISLFHYDRYSSIAGQWAAAIFDNVKVTDVPEPATLALLALGGIALLRRR